MIPPTPTSEAANQSPPPPFVDAELQHEVYVSTIGTAPPGLAADLRSFFIAVHRCCVQWLARNEDGGDAGASAFVLTKRIEVDPVYAAHDSEFEQAPRLDGEPPAIIPGPIVLTTGNLRLAFSRNVSDPKVSGIVAELETLGLGDRPTAIFVPAERTLHFYQCGVAAGETLISGAEIFGGLDITDLPGLFDQFHEKYTRFPDGFGNCWISATDRVVNKNAENAIRNSLFTFLAFIVFRTQYIVREHQLPNGRVDIFIWGFALDDPAAHRVLELKVLRSRSSGWKPGSAKRSKSRAFNQTYTQRGVRQAQRYMQASDAAEAYLLCFDAQLENEDLEVDEYAAERNVIYRRYYMESSTSEQ